MKTWLYFFVDLQEPKAFQNRIVSFKDHWITSALLSLQHGIHVFAHPRDLTSEQLSLVYKIFTGLPSYQQSVFHYQRQQFIARVAERTEVEIEGKATDGFLELDDESFEHEID